MKAYVANTVNGLVLVFIGFLGAVNSTSETAFIAPVVGSFLLCLTPFLKKEMLWSMWLMSFVTFVFFVLLCIRPLPEFIAESPMNLAKIFRTVTMIFSCFIALLVYLRFFKGEYGNQ